MRQHTIAIPAFSLEEDVKGKKKTNRCIGKKKKKENFNHKIVKHIKIIMTMKYSNV